MPNRISQFWQELKRRKVIHVITVYAGVAFVVIELINNVTEPLRLPEWTPTLVIILLLVGFPIAVIFSWIYDFHPLGGIVKTKPAKKIQKEELPKFSNSWMIASYSSFVVILILISINLIPKISHKESNQILDKSIAVLPFKSLSDDPEKQYLADGVMDATILNLSKIEDMRVMSRTTVEQYRETNKSVNEICNELDVAYLLEGSFQKFGDQVRIIVQLIKSGEEGHVWGGEYDREWKDILNVQSELAQAIATELQVAITPEEKDLIEKVPTYSLTAYDFYQRGREEYLKFTLNDKDYEALERAEGLYLRALNYDSSFAKAYSGLAQVYADLHAKETYFQEDYLDSVLILCNKALSYDNQLAEAYTGRAFYYYEYNQMQIAVEECNKAIKYNPNDWLAYYNKGIFYTYSGSNFIEAIRNLNKAKRLHTGELIPDIYYSLGRVYAYTGFTELASQYFKKEFELYGDSVNYLEGLSYIEGHILGNYQKAINLSKEGYKIDSTNSRILGNLGKFYMFLGEYEESLKYYEKLLAQRPSWGDKPQGFLHRAAFVYLKNGYKEESDRYYNRLLYECRRSIELGRNYASSEAYYDLASTYAVMGQRDEAYENLHHFVQTGQNALYYITLLKNDPFFNSIRDDLEFQEIISEIEAKSIAERELIKRWLEENDML